MLRPLRAELAGDTLCLDLNHRKRAVETHATNFQDADLYYDEVRSLTTGIHSYPDLDILLTSPERTNHSLTQDAQFCLLGSGKHRRAVVVSSRSSLTLDLRLLLN